MNKLLILSIILINALTLYYAKYYTISDQDASAYVLAEQLLDKNRQIIDITNNHLQTQIDRQALGYSQFRVQADQAKSIGGAYREITKILGVISNEINDNYQHFSNKEIERVKSQSLNYAIAQKTVVENKWLDSLIKTINIQQKIIEQNIQEDSIKTKWKAEFQFKPMVIKEQLTKKSVRHTLFELDFIMQHCKEATNFLLKPIKESIIEPYNFNAIFASVIAKSDFIQLGETYKADINLINYLIPANDTLVEIKVNSRVIPVEKGIGLYETKANKVGKKVYVVNYILKNSLTGKRDTYKRRFEYEVIDCK